MLACQNCPKFQIIPDVDIDGEIFYYSLCGDSGRLVNNGYHEFVRRPSWCADVRAEHLIMACGCGDLDVLLNPVLTGTQVIDYRLKQLEL